MADKKDCVHPELQFGSGDYYLFCHACNAQWMRCKPGKKEYAIDAEGNAIGGAPEEANVGEGKFNSGHIRVTPEF